MKAYDLHLLFLQKIFFALGVAHTNPFFVQVAPKKSNFERFYQFFRTTGFQLKLLMLIESPNIFHWKSAKQNKVGVVLGTKFGPK